MHFYCSLIGNLLGPHQDSDMWRGCLVEWKTTVLQKELDITILKGISHEKLLRVLTSFSERESPRAGYTLDVKDRSSSHRFLLSVAATSSSSMSGIGLENCMHQT